LGEPLDSRRIKHERLSNAQGLAVFSSDPLSSTAYATEEILLVLASAGAAALSYALPISIAITSLIFIVILSYRQTIHAYPQGGGAYSVAKDNLGMLPALTAASALLIDYTLTVAVSISAGIAALTSAIPSLFPFRVELALASLAIIAWGNLRGIRESGRLFSIPTYFFVISMFGLIGYGFWRYITGTLPHGAPAAIGGDGAILSIGFLLLLRAFAAGCTALTGIEATSNGVQAFKPPEATNASNTMTRMGIMLGVIFIGISALARALSILPKAEETVVSQVAAGLFGRTLPYFLVQAATMFILILAANTSFAGFPRLGSILARDGYFPRHFRELNLRLAYSSGILALAAAAGALIIFFQADTHRIIPLYAVGVFLVFTISQFGMVRHWKSKHQHDHKTHRWNIAINMIGGTLTGIVLAVVFLSKFGHGAWILVPATLALIIFMRAIHNHYDSVAQQLSLAHPTATIPAEKTVIIPISGVHQGTMKAIEFVKTLNPARVKAVHVAMDPEESNIVRKKWLRHVRGIPLDIIASPYRDIIEPLIDYIDKECRKRESDVVIVAVPEFIPTRWWHHFLHHRTAKYLRDTLTEREDVIIVDVPYRLQDEKPFTMRSFIWLALWETFKNIFRGIGWIFSIIWRAVKPRKKEPRGT